MTRKAYLCGAINGCTDAQANGWRDRFIELWPGEISNPMRRDYRGKERESVKPLVERDKIDVSACDVMIINAPSPSWGTGMEWGKAWDWGKPCVVVVPDDGKPLSPWVIYHSHAIVHTYEDAVTAALDLLS